MPERIDWEACWRTAIRDGASEAALRAVRRALDRMIYEAERRRQRLEEKSRARGMTLVLPERRKGPIDA